MITEFPPEPFNSHVRDGTIGAVVGKIVESLDFESLQFVELDALGVKWR